MNTGVVKFFDTQKGFGFITPNDGGKDVFVHISALSLKGIRSLNDGQKVSYDLQEERGKTSATNISLEGWSMFYAPYAWRMARFKIRRISKWLQVMTPIGQA